MCFQSPYRSLSACLFHHHHCQSESQSLWQRSAGGVFRLEAESIGPQCVSSFQIFTLHHALSGMEEKDNKENVRSFLFSFYLFLHLSNSYIVTYLHGALLFSLSARWRHIYKYSLCSWVTHCLKPGSIKLLFRPVQQTATHRRLRHQHSAGMRSQRL